MIIDCIRLNFDISKSIISMIPCVTVEKTSVDLLIILILFVNCVCEMKVEKQLYLPILHEIPLF